MNRGAGHGVILSLPQFPKSNLWSLACCRRKERPALIPYPSSLFCRGMHSCRTGHVWNVVYGCSAASGSRVSAPKETVLQTLVIYGSSTLDRPLYMSCGEILYKLPRSLSHRLHLVLHHFICLGCILRCSISSLLACILLRAFFSHSRLEAQLGVRVACNCAPGTSFCGVCNPHGP